MPALRVRQIVRLYAGFYGVMLSGREIIDGLRGIGWKTKRTSHSSSCQAVVGRLGGALESIARWSPVGTVITVFAGVLSPAAWTSTDSLALLACSGYIVVCAAIGIRWFKWNAR